MASFSFNTAPNCSQPRSAPEKKRAGFCVSAIWNRGPEAVPLRDRGTGGGISLNGGLSCRVD